jgi:D-glycero-D-manno-heptose 1,7-bisphosphate phosphatase
MSAKSKQPAKKSAAKSVAKSPPAKKTPAKSKPAKKAVAKPIAKTKSPAPSVRKPVVPKETPPAKRRAIFFDRDGVINESPGEGSYVLSWWDFQFLPDVDKVLAWLKQRGWLLILVTNQQCVGKGLISQAQLDAVHDRMQEELGKKAAFDAIYACTALKSEHSPMRKPAPGMVLAAAEKFDLDLSQCWLVGDHDRDIELARNAGVGRAVRYVSEKKISLRADFTVSTHTELLTLLKKYL